MCLRIILIYKIIFRPSMRPSVHASVRASVNPPKDWTGQKWPEKARKGQKRAEKARKGQERQTMRGNCWKQVERDLQVFLSSFVFSRWEGVLHI